MDVYRYIFIDLYKTLTKLKLMRPIWMLENWKIEAFAINCIVNGIIEAGSQGENSNTSITKEL